LVTLPTCNSQWCEIMLSWRLKKSFLPGKELEGI
jgi:hypothetical protein